MSEFRKWKIWQSDGQESEEDATVITASDIETAIEQWAEDYDSDEHSIVSGTEQKVWVRCVDGGLAEEWIVRGEAQCVYWATYLREEKAP